MRFYNSENRTDLNRAICNKCKKEMRVENGYLREGCFEGNQVFGYFSSRDRMRYRFDLCEKCFDEMIAGFLIPAEIAEETEVL